MMQASQAMELASRFFHGQDRLKGPLPAELCASSYRAEIVGFPPMDAAGHGQFGAALYAAFPDITHTIDEVGPPTPALLCGLQPAGLIRARSWGFPRPTVQSVPRRLYF